MKNTTTTKELPAEIVHVIEAMQEIVVIIDSERRIVSSNQSFKDFAKEYDLSPTLGLTPGSAFNCIYAIEANGACGSTSFCKYCGGNRSIITSREENKRVVDNCKIVSLNGVAFELQVSASPVVINGDKLTVYAIMDISSESRKQALEKIFFHDINNTLNVISMLTEVIKDNNIDGETDDYIALLKSATRNLAEELKSYHILNIAEKDELQVSMKEIELKALTEECVQFFSNCTYQSGSKIYTKNFKSLNIKSDQIILSRIVMNAIKNACEASSEDDEIIVDMKKDGNFAVISVNNPSVMPDEAKKSIFKRSFSTKGTGRGLGTYSMRLLGEKYLKGHIYFTSEEGEGTTFYIKIPINL